MTTAPAGGRRGSVIAIDGPSGSGKTTIAACLAVRLGVPWLSSGALYRAVTRLMLDRLGAGAPAAQVSALVRAVNWKVTGATVRAGQRALTGLLHSAEVDRHVAQVSSIAEVRRAINHLLRRTVDGGRWVVEGRDIGTEVFPEAVLKVYLDADPKVRAERRARQHRSVGAGREAAGRDPAGPEVAPSVAQVSASLAERDRHDRHKSVGALRPAADAKRIDTSHLTVPEVCAKLFHIVPTNFLPE